MKRILDWFRPAWPPFPLLCLLSLLAPACRTVAPAALDLAQHVTAPYYLHVEGNVEGQASVSLLGLGLPAGASGELSLRERVADGPRLLWSAAIDTRLYRGYRLVAHEGAIDLVGLTCAEAIKIWPDVGPCEVAKRTFGAPAPAPKVLYTVKKPKG